jgi:hypothetical protein
MEIVQEERKIATHDSKQLHINGLLRLKDLDTSIPVLEHLVNRNERYHMAALHRRWFNSDRKKREAQDIS